MVRNASPKVVRRFCVFAALLYFFLAIAVAGWELYVGRATVSQRKGLPNRVASRQENPSLYWAYFKNKLLWSVALSGGLIAFGQFIVWLNHRPGAPKTWEDDE
jgi:hypothetical protein